MQYDFYVFEYLDPKAKNFNISLFNLLLPSKKQNEILICLR